MQERLQSSEEEEEEEEEDELSGKRCSLLYQASSVQQEPNDWSTLALCQEGPFQTICLLIILNFYKLSNNSR